MEIVNPVPCTDRKEICQQLHLKIPFLLSGLFQKGFFRIFCIFLALLFCSGIKAQEDTVWHKYIVDKKTKKTRNNGQVSSMVLPPVGCALTGPGTANRGSISSYLLSCSDGELAEYWEISCGTAIEAWADEVVVQWSSSSGCTSGTVKAWKMDGTLLATNDLR